MAKSILHTIESGMDAFSKGQKRIARYILEHYDEAAFLTASRLGEVARVSESTVVRFASELGYEGYPGMQMALRDLTRKRMTSTQRLRAAGSRFSGGDLPGAVLLADMETLRQTADQADRAVFDSVVERILAARHVYILGVRSSSFVAGYLHFYMHLLFEKATLIHSDGAGAIFEQLFRAGPDDVVIAISFPRYSQMTVNTVRFARDRGACVIALTDTPLSPVYGLSDAALLAPCQMLSFVDSMVAPLSLANALLVALAGRMDTDVSAAFSQLEDIWNAYGVFGRAEDE